MAFNITIPYVIATHVKKYTSVTAFKNKSKASAIGSIGGVLMVNNGTTVTPVGAGTGAVVASGGGTSRALLAASNGSTNLFDVATNFSYSLPTPVIGMDYSFLWTVLETGGQAHVVTAGAGVFLNGAVQAFSGEAVTPAVNLGPYQFSGNGTTHIKTTSNGTTLGGGIGQNLRFRCTAAGIWTVTGTIVSPSGTLATPFST